MGHYASEMCSDSPRQEFERELGIQAHWRINARYAAARAQLLDHYPPGSTVSIGQVLDIMDRHGVGPDDHWRVLSTLFNGGHIVAEGRTLRIISTPHRSSEG